VTPDGQGRPGILALPIRLVINLAAPVLAYALLRPHVHSDLIALIIGAAVPIAYTVGVLLWRRRLDAIGVFAIVCFVFGLLLVLVTGGNELTFKLREDIWTGPAGLACLISVAMRRPLFAVVLRRAAQRNPDIAGRVGDPQVRRIMTVTTAGIGVILLVHALIMVALALTTSTATFLAVSRPLSLAIVGGGLAALVWWIRNQHVGRSNLPPHRASDAEVTGGRKDHHAHSHNPEDGHHQRADRRRVAPRSG
jgi:hypothetical protein